VRLVATFLGEAGDDPAALRHLELADRLAPDEESPTEEASARLIESNPAISPWQKNPYTLSEPPEGLPAAAEARFREALGWAEDGLWAAAASAFELLAADHPQAAREANRNLGLCRLWLADNAAASAALARAISRSGATPEAVDLEALRQQIAPLGPDDLVDHVQWIWPLRNREGLLTSLRAEPTVNEYEPAPIDPNDPESPQVDQFVLLDKPRVEARKGLGIAEIPRVVARLHVGQEIVALESYDDGRLDALGERFTALAGAAIAPAHPRTKVLGKSSRSTVALMWEWLVPEGLDRDEVARLTREQGAWLIREAWPRTPMAYLGGRTPQAAAAAGDAEVPLRAAILQHELSPESWRDGIDFAGLRASLGINPEPEVDPETVDIRRLHLARFRFVPVERLSDERLVAFYRRAQRYALLDAAERAVRGLLDRPSAAALGSLEPSALYSGLAFYLAVRGQKDEAMDALRRGRQAEPAATRGANAVRWDMLEMQLRARLEPPESWVPDLAVMLDRYGEDQASNRRMMTGLVEMGLIRLVPRSEQSDEIVIDPRPLQALLAEYGPRVTTASGRLGVAAARGGIWTPGSEGGGAGSGGAIWTPGSGNAPSSPSEPGPPGGEKSRLIIPGR
jgi:hypothetical protein